jgi:hypothetical protein
MRGSANPHTRLVVFAVIFNLMLWSQVRLTNHWPLVIVLPYAIGFITGWVINPFFRPRRDQWAKSAYNRLSIRVLRAMMIGGLFGLLALIVVKGVTKS